MWERIDPKIEVVEKMLPLLQPMHSMAQQCVDTFNDLFPDDKFPDIPVPDTRLLDDVCRDIINDKRFGNTQVASR